MWIGLFTFAVMCLYTITAANVYSGLRDTVEDPDFPDYVDSALCTLFAVFWPVCAIPSSVIYSRNLKRAKAKKYGAL